MQTNPSKLKRLSIAIPASIVSDTPHLREKTAKLGTIARASSIFGVNEIILYTDAPHQNQQADMEFSREILEYLETPQYLRKRIFKLNPALRFTGILPPLQAPHHVVPATTGDVKIGDIREGFVVARGGNGGTVDVGLERAVSVAENCSLGERVTIRLVRVGGNLRGEIVGRSKIGVFGPDMRPMYWGYTVRKSKSLGKLLTDAHWNLKVGTSRYGTAIQEVWTSVSRDLTNAESTVVVFGSPKKGLSEILGAEKLVPNDVFDYFVNTVPDQHTMTVRTEEAILLSLGILNLARKLRR